MLFKYKAKNLGGETVEGMIEAINQDIAMNVLTGRQLIILSLVEAKTALTWGRSLRIGFFKKVKQRDMIFLSRQLAMMVMAGLPLVKSLEILAKQTVNTYLKNVVNAITEDVRGGTRFSSALAKYPEIFDNFYINMVRAGETAGKLDEVLGYLADENEKNFDLMNKIKGAMIYPAFVITAVTGVMILMLTFVIPQLKQVLTESGVDLPLATKILTGISDFFKNHFLYIVPGIIVLIAALVLSTKTKIGRLVRDRIILRLPVFGQLFQNFYVVRFTRSLATLIVGGVPLTSALKIVSEIVENTVYKNLILQSIKDVEEGSSIAKAFLESKAVPKMVSHLLVVGERTGKLDEILDRMADFYAREVDSILSRLVTLLEPAIIIFLGVVVGGMVASIIFPMFKLSTAF